MFNLDPGKLLVIAVVAIILLGPDRLPQVARQVGGAWRSFNEFRHRMESEVRSTMPDLPPTSEIARLARSPSALLNHLSNMSSDDDEGEETDGSFQPQPPVNGNGTVDAAAGPEANGATATAATAATAATGSDATVPAQNGRDPVAASANGHGPETAAVPPPEPRPAAAREHADPGPPDVIVPGDPTLN